ncbi:MAG TPA: MFS transporter, partial [Candidatus Limnocylindrales bacterium]
MTRADRLALLAVLAAGVFLAGLELMITAVALPSILEGLASWTQLRHASWIVNGYLLVYVVAMPLAGRLSDIYGARRLFLGALAAFTVGALLCGVAQTLDQLIAARLVQAVGGGALVPVATAAASHLFTGRERPRALGLVSALTFLGMAAGPFAGAAILEILDPGAALAAAGIVSGPAVDLLAPAWRWIFYLDVPIGIAALALGWAASTGWETPRIAGRVDIAGAVLFSGSLAALIAGVTLTDDDLGRRLFDPTYPPVALMAGGVIMGVVAVAVALRRSHPFVDPRLFARPTLAAASLVALLTGYALATAIVGGAVFVDRVLYGGPDAQRVVLGALAASTAAAALLAGFLVHRLSARVVTVG